jgi:hypothetical protein
LNPIIEIFWRTTLHRNLRAQKHQTIAADLIGLDTPRLSNLQEKLREFQQREQTIPEAEKEL